MLSTIDLQSGYHQVILDDDAKEKSAVCTHMGLFQWRVMSFGLTNAPATFERMMEAIMGHMHWKQILVYLDDIIVFASDFETHMERLTEVLRRLRDAGLKINPKKCQFFRESVLYLGHVVSESGVGTDPEKVAAVKDWPVPKSIHDIRAFLGTTSYYRRFISGYADIAKPLHKLTEKNQTFDWTPQCQAAFDKLKQKLISASVLAYPDPSKPFLLDCDCSGFALGSVLSQTHDGQEHPVAYYSHTLSRAERNYCVTRRELLAVVESIKHFHPYLYGVEFKVWSDHGALSWLLRFNVAEGQLCRWFQVLSTYHFTLEYRRGALHRNADGLSRRPCIADQCSYCQRQEEKSTQVSDTSSTGQPTCSACKPGTKSYCTVGTQCEESVYPDNFENNTVRAVTRSQNRTWLTSMTSDQWHEEQMQDRDLKLLYDLKKQQHEKPQWDSISPCSLIVKALWWKWDQLEIRDEVLYRKHLHSPGSITTMQILVPRHMESQILTTLHDDPAAGHLGIKRTLSRVQQRFYWVNYRTSIELWIQGCVPCQARKNPPKPARAAMKQFPAGHPNQRIGIDFLGPVRRTDSGNAYILVISDYFTKWTEAFAVADMCATTVADILVNQYITRFGIVREIISDQGKQFESELFRELCSRLGIDKKRCSPGHPQNNGLVERFNKTLLDMLAKYIDSNQRNWDKYLQLVMLAYRSSVHDSTGFSPAFLTFGREIELPCDLLYGCGPQDSHDSHPNYLTKLITEMDKIHHVCRDKMEKASHRQKRLYDHRINLHKYQIGSPVWLRVYARRKGLSPKLMNHWGGPYMILQALSDRNYKIQKGPKFPSKIIHHDRLKPFKGNFWDWRKAK